MPDGSYAHACPQYHAPLDHRPAPCVICGLTRAHVAGIGAHLTRDHHLRPGGRAAALALDYSRAVVRGWPSDVPRARFDALSTPIAGGSGVT